MPDRWFRSGRPSLPSRLLPGTESAVPAYRLDYLHGNQPNKSCSYNPLKNINLHYSRVFHAGNLVPDFDEHRYFKHNLLIYNIFTTYGTGNR